MPQEPTRKPPVESKSYRLGDNLSKLLSSAKNAVINRNDYDRDAIEVVGEDVGDWQTKQDAARHILRSAELARKTNPTVAKIGASLYELLTGSSSPEDAQMDEHNNAIGISMADAKDYEEIKKRTKEVMKKASYQDFNDPTSPVFLRMESENSKTTYTFGQNLKKLLGAVVPDAGAAEPNQVQKALGFKEAPTGISAQSAAAIKKLDEDMKGKKEEEKPPIREDKGLSQSDEYRKVFGDSAADRKKAAQEAKRKKLLGITK